MTVAIIDYGMGNLFSVSKALEVINVPYDVVTDPGDLSKYERAILPGVGAFYDGMTNLQERGWIQAIKLFSLDKALLGICLGMQLLMTTGFEPIETTGLNIIPGKVVKLFEEKSIRLPHVGWNELMQKQAEPLFTDIQQGEDFYFVHSYCCKASEPQVELATSFYGKIFTSVIKHKRVYGVQFHPEKSGTNGLILLKNFCEIC